MGLSHVSHRGSYEVLLFMPRDQAGALRSRLVSDAHFRDVNVSPLYRVGTGWAVALCPECQVEVRGRSHPAGRSARPVGTA
jgi:hypothetical protein